MTQTLTRVMDPVDSARSMPSAQCEEAWALLLLLGCPAACCPSPALPAPATCCASAENRRKVGAVSAACSLSLLMTVSAQPETEKRNHPHMSVSCRVGLQGPTSFTALVMLQSPADSPGISNIQHVY